MKIMILHDCKESKNPWTGRFYGIIDELKAKRLPYKSIADINEAVIAPKGSCIVLASGDNVNTTKYIVETCNIHDIPVILVGGSTNKYNSYRFSSVTTDWDYIGHTINNYLNFYGKTRIALYGVNPKAYCDLDLTETFFSNITFNVNNNSRPVFDYAGSISETFNLLYERINEFDAIICVNDLLTLHLVDKLKEIDPDQLKRLFIISINNLWIARVHSPSLSTFSGDYQKLINAVLDIYKLLSKHHDGFTINIKLTPKFNIRETTHNAPMPNPPQINETSQNSNSDFIENTSSDFFGVYADQPEIHEYSRVQKVIAKSDDLCKFVIKCLLENKAIEKIAYESFSSPSSIKKRIKKMCVFAEVSNKKELTELLQKHIDYENFKNVFSFKISHYD